MDFLKAEIANKRKALASGSGSSSSSPEPASKYVRRGERKEVEVVAAPPPPKVKSQSPAPTSTWTSTREPAKEAYKSSTPATTKESFNISNEEAIRRLRAKGQPIRLFAETDKERRLRLRALELIEERGEKSGQNDFRNALASAESDMALELLERRNASAKGKDEREKDASVTLTGAEEARDKDKDKDQDQDAEAEAVAVAVADKKSRDGIGMDSLLDLNLIKTDMARVYPIIYYTLKGVLQDWAEHLAARPDEIKQSTQGKLAAATQVQSAEYLKPLFKLLRKRALAPDVLMRIAEIVHYMQKREYRHANDSYLQLSIGNAPWPIGVTMVGIHERSGREKIFSSNVAHVLNDEESRKYIQSLKRLLTFAQTKYPPKDVSMMMG